VYSRDCVVLAVAGGRAFSQKAAYNIYVRHRQTRGDHLLLNITGLDWGDDQDAEGNVRHIARHKVSVGEVTEVMTSAPVFVRAETEGDNPYFVAVGYTTSGRLLEVWGIYYESPQKAGWWRTVTAMTARPKQRALWNKERGGGR